LTRKTGGGEVVVLFIKMSFDIFEVLFDN